MRQPTARFGLGVVAGGGAMTALLAVLAASSLLSIDHIATAQPAPLDPEDVVLVHVSPDGSDYLGNPYCPNGGQPEVIEPDAVDDDADTVVDNVDEEDIVDRALDDCNNVMGQDHVVRTRDWNPLTMSNPDWMLANGPAGDPANAAIIVQGACGTIAEVVSRPQWDPIQPPPLASKDDEQCTVIKSTV